MNKIFKFLLISTGILSTAIAQEAALEETATEGGHFQTIEDVRAEFPSALPAGDVGDLRGLAKIKVTENHYFLDGSDTNKLLVEMGNLPGSYTGSIVDKDFTYFVIFEFEATGYIKDEDKDDLDADELMDTFLEGNKEGNKQRVEQGLPELKITGWSHEPEYVSSTNRVIWGQFLESTNGKFINHDIRLLGRTGVMSAQIVCDADQIQAIIPIVDTLLEGYEFNDGQKYSQFEEGDKVADYGLKALIVGGGVFAASKLGLFALLGKFWKAIVGGIVAVGYGIKKFFSRS